MKTVPKDPERLKWGGEPHHPVDGEQLVTGRLTREIHYGMRAISPHWICDTVWAHSHQMYWWMFKLNKELLCKPVHLPLP